MTQSVYDTSYKIKDEMMSKMAFQGFRSTGPPGGAKDNSLHVKASIVHLRILAIWMR